MTKTMRSRKQASEMGFLKRVAGVSPRDKVRSPVDCEEVGIKPLLLCAERIQLRWFGHLVKDASWSLPCGGVPGTSSREEAPEQTQVQVERLYLCTGLQSDQADVAREREVCGLLLKLVPPLTPPQISG